jgi:hypothetical protein
MYQHFFGDRVSLCIMCFYALPKKNNFSMLNPSWWLLQMMLFTGSPLTWHLLCLATWINCNPHFISGLTVLLCGLFSLFVWVWRFAGCHKTETGGGCFLRLQRFSASVSVWGMRFLPHALHGSMLKPLQCGCGGMYRLSF